MLCSAFLRFTTYLLIGLGCLLIPTSRVIARDQRFVQIDVRVAGGNPAGLEFTNVDGKLIKAWDTSFFDESVVPPDPKICIENNGHVDCVDGDCPDMYVCTFIGVPISSDTFNLEVWDADIQSAFDDGDDLIGKGQCGINRTCLLGQASVQVTPIPCNDKEIQINYNPGWKKGHYMFDSGFEYYPDYPEETFHHYERIGRICDIAINGCNVKTVFSTMISQVSFVAPSTDDTPLINCKVNELENVVTANPVRTTVNTQNSTIVNYTLKGHLFYPGKITREVVSRGGSVVVKTTGEGYGTSAGFNVFMGRDVIFKKIDEHLFEAVMKKLQARTQTSPATVKKSRVPVNGAKIKH